MVITKYLKWFNHHFPNLSLYGGTTYRFNISSYANGNLKSLGWIDIDNVSKILYLHDTSGSHRVLMTYTSGEIKHNNQALGILKEWNNG